MKTRLNNKILFHWIFIMAVSGLLLFYTPNMPVIYFIVSFMMMTLIFNRASFLKIKSDNILITKTYFLFIPTFKFLINIKDITRLSLIDYRDIEINNSRKYAEFEAVIIVEALTGTLFYKPEYILVIDLKQNRSFEFEINADRKSMLKMITLLQKQINERNNQPYGI
ncbi:MAG TPA: hypothetical protein VJ896_07085 [Bacteroidales bacterium]|nr:hypothetical protein [Bacteroidales bacterium]